MAMLFDESCTHGGPAPSSVTHVRPLLNSIFANPRLWARPFDLAALRPSLLKYPVLASGTAASLVLSMAADALGKNDISNCRLFFRIAVTLAAFAWSGDDIWPALRSISPGNESITGALLQLLVQYAEVSDTCLEEALLSRIPCECFRQRDSLPVLQGRLGEPWAVEKATAAKAFAQGNWESAANQYLDAADLLIHSPEFEVEMDGGILRVLTGIRVGPCQRDMREVGLVLAKLYSNISLCRMKFDKPDSALAAADEAVNFGVSFAKAHARRGFALVGLNRYREACDAFGTAIQKAGGLGTRSKEVSEYGKFLQQAQRAAASVEEQQVGDTIAQSSRHRSASAVITFERDIVWLSLPHQSVQELSRLQLCSCTFHTEQMRVAARAITTQKLMRCFRAFSTQDFGFQVAQDVVTKYIDGKVSIVHLPPALLQVVHAAESVAKTKQKAETLAHSMSCFRASTRTDHDSFMKTLAEVIASDYLRSEDSYTAHGAHCLLLAIEDDPGYDAYLMRWLLEISWPCKAHQTDIYRCAVEKVRRFVQDINDRDEAHGSITDGQMLHDAFASGLVVMLLRYVSKVGADRDTLGCSTINLLLAASSQVVHEECWLVSPNEIPSLIAQSSTCMGTYVQAAALYNLYLSVSEIPLDASLDRALQERMHNGLMHCKPWFEQAEQTDRLHGRYLLYLFALNVAQYRRLGKKLFASLDPHTVLLHLSILMAEKGGTRTFYTWLQDAGMNEYWDAFGRFRNILSCSLRRLLRTSNTAHFLCFGPGWQEILRIAPNRYF